MATDDKDGNGLPDPVRSKAEIKDNWKNRRRMSWVSLISILVVTYLALFHVPIERLKILEQVITWFYFVMGSIIGAYVGFATLDDIKTRKP
jgi:hypothetical protein